MAQINIIDYNKIVYFDENTGNYKIFDGERWWLSDDKFGTSTKPSDVALVDSAIVDTSVVGEEEAPPMQTIWEGTFTGLKYLTEDIQNSSLLRNVKEVTVTFDGVVYTATVTKRVMPEDVNVYSFGASNPSFSDYPFMFSWTDGETPIIIMSAKTDGEHTMKVEYTPSPEPAMQTIWEGTFTGEYIEQIQAYNYQTNDLQNCELLENISEVVVTFDGATYTLPVESLPSSTYGFMVGASDPSFGDYPFMFLAMSFKSVDRIEIVNIYAQTAGPHTLKVEGTPVEPSSEVLYENTFSGTSLNTADVQNLWKITEMQAVKATFDSTSYILNVDRDEEHDMWSLGSSAFADCPFFLTIVEITDTDTETSETSYEMTLETGTSGEHTIKIEGTPSDNEDIPTDNPIADIPGGTISDPTIPND